MTKRKSFQTTEWKTLNVPALPNFDKLVCVEELTDYEVSDKNIFSLKEPATKIPKTAKHHDISLSNVNDPKLEGTLCDPRSSTKKSKKTVKKKKEKEFKKKPKKKLAMNNEKILGAIAEVKKNEGDVVEHTNDIDMSEWMTFGIPDVILHALRDKKFTSPTEIQSLALPIAMKEKRDILGAAETGSGKTLAFGIPIISDIIRKIHASEDNNRTRSGLSAVIVIPTRELAVQVSSHLKHISTYAKIKIVEVIGGLAVEKQNRKLASGADIVVGTIGRLWQLIQMDVDSVLAKSVKSARYLVVDEADRMVEKGHFPQLLSLMEFLEDSVNQRQTFVFSATLGLVHSPPSYLKKKIRRKSGVKNMTAKQKLTSIIKQLGLKKDSAIIDITNNSGVSSKVHEWKIECSADEKDIYLYYALATIRGRCIVFCNTIHCVQRLLSLLRILEVKTFPLFANMQQKQRLANLEKFGMSDTGLLLATDVAARGLDIAHVSAVIHYQVPRTAEMYVHRSGRTGRRNEGHSILLCSPQECITWDNISSTLHKTDRIMKYDTSNHALMKIVRCRIGLAVQIDEVELRLKRDRVDRNWIQKAAEEAEILLDEDELPDQMEDEDLSRNKKALRRLRNQLDKIQLPRCFMN